MIPVLTAVHATLLVLWIGGVAFVTMIIFPMLLKMEDSFEKVLTFQRIENTFAKHARIYAWSTGITGFLLLYLRGEDAALFTRTTIGSSVMVVVWTVYVLVLTFEKRLFGIIFRDQKDIDAGKIFFRLSVFHWVVLGLSLAAIFVGVLAGHGGL